MKKIHFLAHDPGGYDVIYPVVEKLRLIGEPVEFYCIGPASTINPQWSINEDIMFEKLRNQVISGQVSLLVTGTSWGSDSELCAISFCKELGIPTLSILDYWSNYLLRFKYHDRFVFPNYYIVMDERAKEEAVQEGVRREVLRVLGHPGLDRFIRERPERKPTGFNKKRALFLSQPLSQLYGETLGYTEENGLEDCIQAFGLHTDWSLSIKFHPKDTEEVKRKYSPWAVDGDLLHVLTDYDLIIGMNTMGLLHAALLGVPTISYQPNLRQADMCITSKLGFTPLITSFDHLVLSISRFHENYNQALDEMKHRYIWLDGNSTERVVSFIQEVVGNYED